MKICKLIAVAALGLALVASAGAQTTRYGDPNWVLENDFRSGMPIVLTLSTQDMGYEFDGNPLNIPFTITLGCYFGINRESKMYNTPLVRRHRLQGH